ncbi:MAG TPA: glutamyl-tRNA reductase [Ktedonobacterales bacterium]|jgi:glutamyl-tRNA reductase
MRLILVGLDYRTAPLELRERLQADDAHLLPLLATLRHGPLNELVVLSTCNRYEVFATCDDATLAQDAITDCLLSAESIPMRPLLDSLYHKDDADAVRHLFRVAAGLESLVLGETQIMRQLAEALDQAHQSRTTGALLNRLYTAALHTGKRARTETAISQHTLSVSHAAAQLVQHEVAIIERPHILVVGAGEMATLAAGALAQHATNTDSTITIINRSDDRARAVASQLGIQARPWAELQPTITSADAVITATSARQPILRADEIATSARDFVARPLLLVDIGVPRNIAPAANPMPAIRLHDIDDLQAVVAQHRILREAEVAQVEAIIEVEALKYVNWLRSRRIVPVLTELRGRADTIAEAELAHALNRLPELNEHERDVVAQMAQRIVNKLLHIPTVNLKWRAAHGDHFDYEHAIRKMFALDAPTEPTEQDAGSDPDDD